MTKGKKTGEFRHMGPHPNLVRLALEQVQQSHSVEQVSEKIVNGKQKGLTNTMAVNMTLHDYRKRMGYGQSESPRRATSPVRPPDKKAEAEQSAQLLKEAAAYIKEKGMDDFDPEAFQKEMLDKLKAKPFRSVPSVKPEKKEKPPSKTSEVELMAGVMDIPSSEEEDRMTKSRMGPGGSAPSGHQ